MHKIEISSVDLIELKNLIKEFANYYEKINESVCVEPWDLDDLEHQVEIGSEIIGIIEPLLHKL